MGTASVVAFAIDYFPQSFLLEKYKGIVSMYRFGHPYPVEGKIQERFEAVLQELNVPEHKAKMIQLFTVFGFDIFHAGWTNGKKGAIIGIPINFTYDDVTSVETSLIQVNNESVNWSTPEARNLLRSLVLSEDAQKFALAREVLRVQTNEPMWKSVLNMTNWLMWYCLSAVANKRLKLFEKSLQFRSAMYILTGAFCWGVWVFERDSITVRYDISTDKQLLEQGPTYVAGGKEFYEKLLARNIALRSITGKQGESKYTVGGNDYFFFRQKTMPLTYRKNVFSDKLKEMA